MLSVVVRLTDVSIIIIILTIIISSNSSSSISDHRGTSNLSNLDICAGKNSIVYRFGKMITSQNIKSTTRSFSNGLGILDKFVFAFFFFVVVDVIVYIVQSIQIEILKVSFYYAIIVIYKILSASGME